MVWIYEIKFGYIICAINFHHDEDKLLVFLVNT